MNQPDRPDDDRLEGDGAATAERGTPAAVDLSGHRRSRTTLALFLAGPVIWTTHFLLVYLVVEAGCTGEGPGLRVFQPPVATGVTLGATVVAAAACVAAALLAYRRWRTDHGSDAAASDPPRSGDHGALVFAGFWLALLGVVTVLFVGVPALVLPAC